MNASSTAPESLRHRIVTIPNALSALRLASVPVFLWLFLNDKEGAAVILYGAGAWTDFFDGYIARKTDSITPLGQVLDPLADRAVIIALAIALLAHGTLPVWLAVAVLLRDAVVLIGFPILAKRGIPRLEVNFLGKTATAALLFGLTWLAISETTWVVAEAGTDIGLSCVVLGATLYWISTWQYALEVRSFLAEQGASS